MKKLFIVCSALALSANAMAGQGFFGSLFEEIEAKNKLSSVQDSLNGSNINFFKVNRQDIVAQYAASKAQDLSDTKTWSTIEQLKTKGNDPFAKAMAKQLESRTGEANLSNTEARILLAQYPGATEFLSDYQKKDHTIVSNAIIVNPMVLHSDYTVINTSYVEHSRNPEMVKLGLKTAKNGAGYIFKTLVDLTVKDDSTRGLINAAFLKVHQNEKSQFVAKLISDGVDISYNSQMVAVQKNAPIGYNTATGVVGDLNEVDKLVAAAAKKLNEAGTENKFSMKPTK